MGAAISLPQISAPGKMPEPQAQCSTTGEVEVMSDGESSMIEDEVSEIIDKQFTDNKPEYLVRWKAGGGETTCTWEPKENLGNCAELLAEFEKKWKGSKTMQKNTNRFTTIEKILERRIANGKREYRVKWRGYDESECTWEPSESFKNPGLVEEFEKEGQRKRMRLLGTASKNGRSRSSNNPVMNRKKVAMTPTPVAESKKRKAGTRTAAATKGRKTPEAVLSVRMNAPTATPGNKTPPVPASSQSSSIYTSGGDQDEAEETPIAKQDVRTRSAVKKGDAGKMSATKKRKFPDPISPEGKKKVVPSTSSKETPAASVVAPSSSSDSSENDEAVAGEPEQEPEKILNATDASGILQYLVKYKGANQLRRVSADEIHAQSPQLALAFYVERRAWEVPI